MQMGRATWSASEEAKQSPTKLTSCHKDRCLKNEDKVTLRGSPVCTMLRYKGEQQKEVEGLPGLLVNLRNIRRWFSLKTLHHIALKTDSLPEWRVAYVTIKKNVINFVAVTATTPMFAFWENHAIVRFIGAAKSNAKYALRRNLSTRACELKWASCWRPASWCRAVDKIRGPLSWQQSR